MNAPRDEYLRVKSICKNRATGEQNLVDMSPATWWHHTSNTPGWPQPIRLTPGTTVWRRSEIESFLQSRTAAKVD